MSNRRSFIEIHNCRSRWFHVEKGGPQGSVLTPSVFITYHCDMSSFLSNATSHFFADDVAAILSGQLGLRYTDQCLDLEKRLKSFLDQLEFYSVLADQPINYSKTEAMFSARAIKYPQINLVFPGNNSNVEWTSNYKYLGYIICTKLGWGKFISHMKTKIRKCISLIKSFKLFGLSSPDLRLAMFHTFTLPIFSWIFSIFPLFTIIQQQQVSHFYFSCLRRLLCRIGIVFYIL